MDVDQAEKLLNIYARILAPKVIHGFSAFELGLVKGGLPEGTPRPASVLSVLCGEEAPDGAAIRRDYDFDFSWKRLRFLQEAPDRGLLGGR